MGAVKRFQSRPRRHIPASPPTTGPPARGCPAATRDVPHSRPKGLYDGEDLATDVAPGVYNGPAFEGTFPGSPLPAAAGEPGFGRE
jgi:hypothetical protein